MSVEVAAVLRRQSRISEISLKRALSSKEATGKLRNGIRFKVSTNGNNVRMLGIADVAGFPYWRVIDKGAKGPFRAMMPETPDFMAWLRARNIPQSASFPIRKKISRDGIKGTNIFTIENAQTFSEVSAALPAAFMAQLRNKLKPYKKI